MNNEKYSVLMSVYFKEKAEYLVESLDSMINQTIPPEEIVIVKDGPLTEELDKTISIYENNHDDLFTIVKLNKNVGLGLALNEGLKVCRNDLIARMDSDDISLAIRCELQLHQFDINPKLSVVGTWTDEFFDKPSNIITSRVVPEKHNDIMKFLRRRSPFNHPTVMYKKSDVLKCGGYKDVLRKEDFDLFIRMLHSNCLSMNIPKSLLLFRSNIDNYKRRKTWVNCSSYISVIFYQWRMGYSSTIDLAVVVIGQFVMLLSPLWLLKLISNKLLREKI